MKTLVLITALSLIAFSIAGAAGPASGPQRAAGFGTIGAATASGSIAAFDRGTGPRDGSGSKMRRGQQQGGTGQESGDRVRKGDGSCGD